MLTLNENAPLTFTKEEVAAKLRISTRTLERRVDAGLIMAIKEGRYMRFTPDAIQAYINGLQSNQLQTA